jgi:MerR family transcriptional regulator, light-induced transcriptional regulator
MAKYSIKDLEKLVDIQAHTIRMWEQRYSVVRPQRTSTNLRVYTDEDVKRLLNISLLNHNGLKISKIAELSKEELIERVLQLKQDVMNTDSQVESLISAMIELNERNFESVFKQLIDKYGLEEAFVNIIYPFLVKIGLLWQTGHINPIHEHFVTSIIRRKLFSIIDSTQLNEQGSKFIMFLPEGEYHEISLLFYTYLVKKNGYYPLYLGQSAPLNDIVALQQAFDAEFLFTSFVKNIRDSSISGYLKQLSKSFKKQSVFISGNIIVNLELKRIPNIKKVKSPEQFVGQLTKLKKD